MDITRHYVVDYNSGDISGWTTQCVSKTEMIHSVACWEELKKFFKPCMNTWRLHVGWRHSAEMDPILRDMYVAPLSTRVGALIAIGVDCEFKAYLISVTWDQDLCYGFDDEPEVCYRNVVIDTRKIALTQGVKRRIIAEDIERWRIHKDYYTSKKLLA